MDRKSLTAGLVVLLVVVVVAIGAVVYGGNGGGYGYLIGNVLGIFAMLKVLAFLSRGRISKDLVTPGKLTVAIVVLVIVNASKISLGLDAIGAKHALQAARSPEDILRVANEHPSNAMLKFLGFVMTLRSEEMLEINALEAAVLPSNLPDFSTVGAMDRAKLEAYRDLLQRAEDKARGLGMSIQKINAAYRERIVAYAKGMGNEDVTQGAIIGFDETSAIFQQRSNKLSQDEGNAIQAIRAQVSFLAQRFGTWTAQNGFLFRDQATVDLWSILDKARTDSLAAYERTVQENTAIFQRRDQSVMGKISQ